MRVVVGTLPDHDQFLCLQKSQFSSQFWSLKILLSASAEANREDQLGDDVIKVARRGGRRWREQLTLVMCVVVCVLDVSVVKV